MLSSCDKSDSSFRVVQFCKSLIWLQTKMDSTWSYYHYLWLLNHFTPNIWLLILLTVCHTILLVSVLRIWYWMNWSFPKLIFLLILCTLYKVSTISVWCCTDTVKINYVLVNHGSYRIYPCIMRARV